MSKMQFSFKKIRVVEVEAARKKQGDFLTTVIEFNPSLHLASDYPNIKLNCK